MKLIRFGSQDEEKPGLLLDGEQMVDVSDFGEDYNESFFADNGLQRLAAWFSHNKNNLPKLNPNVRLGPPVCRPSKIVCIGLNYREHAQESGGKIPDEPVIFFKSTTAITGPNDDLVIPKGSTKTDWEVELAVVMGRKTTYASESEALDHVAGYMLHNDYSERAFQIERSGQWVKGKSCDTFAPLGPFLATQDEIADVRKLRMWLRVNNELMQDSSTSDMIFNVPYIVSYVSQFMTLLPGDIISTGTPSGVGLGLKPPRYLAPGDVVELGIDGLGVSRQKTVALSGFDT